MERSYKLRNVATGIVFAYGYVNDAFGAMREAQRVAREVKNHEAVAIIEVENGTEELAAIVMGDTITYF